MPLLPLIPSASAAIPSCWATQRTSDSDWWMFKLSSMRCHFVALGSASKQTLEMRQRILLSACWPPGGVDDVPGDDIKIEEPGQRAMPDILEFASQHMTGPHGQVGMLAL